MTKFVLLWKQMTLGSWVLMISLSPSLSPSIVVCIDKHVYIQLSCYYGNFHMGNTSEDMELRTIYLKGCFVT
jgi:hypothetical protein